MQRAPVLARPLPVVIPLGVHPLNGPPAVAPGPAPALPPHGLTGGGLDLTSPPAAPPGGFGGMGGMGGALVPFGAPPAGEEELSKCIMELINKPEASHKKYAAFISHYKAEAAWPARALKDLLEPLLGKSVFLDSDDLKDLNDLIQAVRDSDVLVLLQSPSVYTRPYCQVEILTALMHGVPIHCVRIVEGPSAYDFAAASNFLAEFHTSLDTGAADWLRTHCGVEPWDATRLLSCIPKIISSPFDSNYSLRMRDASIADIVDKIREAKPSKVPTKIEWARLLVSQRLSDESLSERALTGSALEVYVVATMMRQSKEFMSLTHTNEEEEEAAKVELSQDHAIQLLLDKHLKLKDIKHYFCDNPCVVDIFPYLDREPPPDVVYMMLDAAERIEAEMRPSPTRKEAEAAEEEDP